MSGSPSESQNSEKCADAAGTPRGGHPFSGNGNAVSWPGSRLPNDVLTEDFSFVLELGWFILKSRIARWITEFQSFPDDGTGSVTTVKAVACALIRQEVTMLGK